MIKNTQYYSNWEENESQKLMDVDKKGKNLSDARGEQGFKNYLSVNV